MNKCIKYEKIETEYKSPLKVIEINFNKGNKHDYIDKHWHRSLEFIIPYTNGVNTWIEGEVFQVYPQSMILINSRKIHECGTINPDCPYHGYAIQLKYDFLSEVLPNISSYEFQSTYNLKDHPRLFELFEKIIETFHTDSKYQYIKIQSLAYELIYELCNHYCININDHTIMTTKNKERLLEILSYLDKHASEPFDATKIAEHFHISYGHLAKLFKTELDMTMKEYVNSIRVRNASFDLLSSDLPIIDIALSHGFVSSKAFYKEFDKVFHMTPKQYRKKIKID